MCGRYAIYDIDGIGLRYDVEVPKDLRPNYNVAPTQMMPVIRRTESGNSILEIMKWGIPRHIGKDLVKQIINTRADKSFGKFWKKTVTTQRCLIPANGFYEWKGSSGKKTPYFIHLKDENLFSFAGIWDEWVNEDGSKLKSFSIMTCEPNAEMSFVHSREPVILRKQNENEWLNTSSDDQQKLEELMFPLGDGSLEIYEVSKNVNLVKNNNGELFLPINSK